MTYKYTYISYINSDHVTNRLYQLIDHISVKLRLCATKPIVVTYYRVDICPLFMKSPD